MKKLAQLERVERATDGAGRRRDLGLLRLVVHFPGHLVQHLGVVEHTAQTVEVLDVGLDIGVLRVELLRPILVIPETGLGDRVLELGQPAAGLVDLQIAVGLVEPSAQRLEIVGEVAHRASDRRTMALLVLLARPARARSVAGRLRPIILHDRLGLLDRARRRDLAGSLLVE